MDMIVEDARAQCAMRFCVRPTAVNDPSFCGPVCRAYATELQRDLYSEIRRAETALQRSQPEYRALTDALAREVI